MKLEKVSFKLAEKLKKAGFDWECLSYWGIDKSGRVKMLHDAADRRVTNYNSDKFVGQCFSAPELELAQRWLRKEKKVHVLIMPKTTPSDRVVYYSYKGKMKRDWNDTYVSHDKVLEAALLDACNLIIDNN